MTSSREPKATKFTRFEAFIGGSWQNFEGTIVRTKDTLTVERELVSAEGKPFRVMNVFNLGQIQAFAIASPIEEPSTRAS
ncbi:hypothetical protein [Bradyrhizobium sp. 142]|uniref:hypothetical protein n=1 Tax=Bradyrhizobium sp. 142 TaxID=2782618 RepID=UPI001FFB347E|nr:hypothetical protein [Bradyrhizobium sp. 142]MCK1732020.1 hypothetical protein [Bradyrhizobium sp. 142]